MEIADGTERFGGSFHRVAAETAVNMKINKAGCEIISAKIDNIFAPWSRLIANVRDLSISHDKFEAVANPVRKNRVERPARVFMWTP